MRFRSAILTTFVLATPVAAMAQPITGLYVGAGAGLHIPQDPKATPYGSGFGTGRVELNEGYGFNSNLAIGYGLGNGFRFEVEGDFMRSDLRQLSGTPFPTATSGTMRTWGVMANALYDMDVGSPYVFPYLGLGAGYQWTSMNSVGSVQPGGPFSFNTDSQSGAFAWQAILGASFPIPNVPGLSLTADYRFMDILGGEKFDGTEGAAMVPAQLKLHNQFNHDLVIGVRYAFNTPAPVAPPMAPAPVAAPAPAPARSYLVFFDWDKAELTDRARSIVKEAADNSTRVQVTRIEVNGYTDTSGRPAYNQALSVRRAQAVAGELVRDGVPRNVINIQGFGDTHLLVSTGPGVREPQNRRVEIIIR
ncbi:MAG TPA: OmpA family protein [Rhodopila sp.]|jgi:outer membrane protein OmpA-like peptidoglycan-associated protein|nr:OmpA family protein [Rhodopila sp.]